MTATMAEAPLLDFAVPDDLLHQRAALVEGVRSGKLAVVAIHRAGGLAWAVG